MAEATHLVEVVADLFAREGEWPKFHRLKRLLGIDVILRPLIDRMGHGVIQADSGTEARVSLRLEVMARHPLFAEDMKRFPVAVRFIADSEADRGSTPITRDEVMAVTDATLVECARLAELLRQTTRIWAGFSPGENGDFRISPADSAFYFSKVGSYDDYLAVLERLNAAQVTHAGQLFTPPSPRGGPKGRAVDPARTDTTGFPKRVRTAGGEYRVGKQIGEGASSWVREAKGPDGAQVAIKILRPGLPSEKAKRFRNELSFLTSRPHEYVLPVLDHGLLTLDGTDTSFFVSPRHAHNLRHAMNEGMTRGKELLVFRQIVLGLQAAHGRGVIHRDLKPENILSDLDCSTTVVADFGIAHFQEDELATAVTTRPQSRLANFEYAAPEQRRPGSIVTLAADIYSLGLILNELFTGRVPAGTGFAQIQPSVTRAEDLNRLVSSMIQQDASLRASDLSIVLASIEGLLAPLNPAPPVGTTNAPLVIERGWTDGILQLTLSHAPQPEWIEKLKTLHNFTFFPGFGPERIVLEKEVVHLPAPRGMEREQAELFDSWTGLASNAYAAHLKQLEDLASQPLTPTPEEERRRVLADLDQLPRASRE